MNNFKYVNPCIMEIVISNKLEIVYDNLKNYI